jgi:hypothetical protein
MVLSDADDVAEAGSAIVLFWNGALEATEEDSVAAVPAVFKEPVAAVFKGTLDDVDKAMPAVLFRKGAPEVSGDGTRLPEGLEPIVPLAEDITWNAEHMLEVLLPEMNSPVWLLR